MTRAGVVASAVFLALLAHLSSPAEEPDQDILGMVVTQDRFSSDWTAEIDGRLVPSGSTLFSPATVATTDERLAIHLKGGRLFHLEAGTRVHVERLAFGAVRLVVEAGVVTYRDEQDKVQKARQGDKVVVLTAQAPGKTAS